MSETAKSDIEKYVHQLECFDWWFNYSDDHKVWRAGEAAAQRLQGERKRLDPDFAIWNKHAPEEFRVPPPENKNL